MPKAYTIITDRPTRGPWREANVGASRYATVEFADGRRYHVGVERNKRVRIAFKPRGHNWGWTYYGFVRDATGRELVGGKVGGSIGVRGLLRAARLLEEPPREGVIK